MHFVSENAGRKHIQAHKDIFSPVTGEKTGVQGAIHLYLERGTAPDWAVAESLKRFNYAMRPTPGSIGGADIPVEQWAVYVDTEEWQARGNHSDEIREKVEALLLSDPEFMQVLPPVARPPWPNYQKLTVSGSRTAEKVAARNLETAAEIGVSIEELVSYEEATLNRDEIVAAYLEALSTRDEGADVLEAIVVEA